MPNPKLLPKDEVNKIEQYLGLLDLGASLKAFQVDEMMRLAKIPPEQMWEMLRQSKYMRTQAEQGVTAGRRRCRVLSSL